MYYYNGSQQINTTLSEICSTCELPTELCVCEDEADNSTEEGGLCPTCGLPYEICVCGDQHNAAPEISVQLEERRYGKEVTVIEGLDPHIYNLDNLLSDLRAVFACGGSVKTGVIELNGDQTGQIKEFFKSKGFSNDFSPRYSKESEMSEESNNKQSSTTKIYSPDDEST